MGGGKKAHAVTVSPHCNDAISIGLGRERKAPISGGGVSFCFTIASFASHTTKK